ncbi:MAG: hypothetical protein HFJ65_02635 [Eggerthellaceae bacterium]|nr:hypothetical protein [Eggerthellaceae bacterium]
MGYEVKLSWVDGAYDEYLTYADPSSGALSSALDSLAESVREISVMKSFKGQAAESAKAYFRDLYPPIISALKDAAAQLKADYAVRYMDRFYQQPVFESGGACLPEDEMEHKRGRLEFAKDERVPKIGRSLDAVRSSLPSGVAFAIPSTASLQGAVNACHGEVEQVKNAVSDIEAQGARIFSNSSHIFSELCQSILAVLRGSSYDLATYEAGAYFQSDGAVPVALFSHAARADQEALHEAMISADRQMYDRQILREEEAYKVLEEGRGQWEVVGLCASVAVTLVGVCAVVASGGVIGAVGAGLGAFKSASSVVTRTQDLISGKNASDRDSPSIKGTTASNVVKSQAKDTAKSIASKFVSSALKGKKMPDIGDIRKTVSGTSSVVGKSSQVVLAFADTNHDRMRTEARERLDRVQSLKDRRAALVA